MEDRPVVEAGKALFELSGQHSSRAHFERGDESRSPVQGDRSRRPVYAASGGCGQTLGRGAAVLTGARPLNRPDRCRDDRGGKCRQSGQGSDPCAEPARHGAREIGTCRCYTALRPAPLVSRSTSRDPALGVHRRKTGVAGFRPPPKEQEARSCSMPGSARKRALLRWRGSRDQHDRGKRHPSLGEGGPCCRGRPEAGGRPPRRTRTPLARGSYGHTPRSQGIGERFELGRGGVPPPRADGLWAKRSGHPGCPDPARANQKGCPWRK